MFSWWFNPKNSFSILKIPIGIILGFAFISDLISGFLNLIDAFRNEPLFTGLFLFVIPVVIPTFFAWAIFWGGLFFLPYYIFEEENGNWKDLLKYIGILLGVSFLLVFINLLVFGWAYSPFPY